MPLRRMVEELRSGGYQARCRLCSRKTHALPEGYDEALMSDPVALLEHSFKRTARGMIIIGVGSRRRSNSLLSLCIEHCNESLKSIASIVG